MRLFFIIFVFVIGSVIAVLVLTNEPSQPTSVLQVPRLEIAYHSLPAMKKNLDSDSVFLFFPEVQAPQVEAATASVEASTGAMSSAISSPTEGFQGGVSREADDRARLLALIEDWVYINYSQVGATKQGRINQTRDNTLLTVFEGDLLSNGIQIAALSEDAATLKLDEAVYHLPLAIEPAFFKELRDSNNPRPLTPEEQKQALEFYTRRYGHKFKAYSENYQPPPGMMMPQQMTQEMHEQSLKEYMARQGKQFQKEGAQFSPPYPYSENQKEAFKKYWETYHPGKPMPSFSDINAYNQQFGAGNRIQAEGTVPPSNPNP